MSHFYSDGHNLQIIWSLLNSNQSHNSYQIRQKIEIRIEYLKNSFTPTN